MILYVIAALLLCSVCGAETIYNTANPPTVDINGSSVTAENPSSTDEDYIVVGYTVDFGSPSLSIVKNDKVYIWNPATMAYDAVRTLPDDQDILSLVCDSNVVGTITNRSNVALKVYAEFTPVTAYSRLSVFTTNTLTLAAVNGTTAASGVLSFDKSLPGKNLIQEDLGMWFGEWPTYGKKVGTFRLVVTVDAE